MNARIKCEWCVTRYRPGDPALRSDQFICRACGRATNILNIKHQCVGCNEWFRLHEGTVRDDLTMVCSPKCEREAGRTSGRVPA